MPHQTFGLLQRNSIKLHCILCQKPEAFTALADSVLEQTEGKALDSGYDFGEYRERVNRYIMEHRNDTLAIHKLTQNIPLSQGDYIEDGNR